MATHRQHQASTEFHRFRHLFDEKKKVRTYQHRTRAHTKIKSLKKTHTKNSETKPCMHMMESFDMDFAMNNIFPLVVHSQTQPHNQIIKSLRFRKALSPSSWSFDSTWNQNEMNKLKKKEDRPGQKCSTYPCCNQSKAPNQFNKSLGMSFVLVGRRYSSIDLAIFIISRESDSN